MSKASEYAAALSTVRRSVPEAFKTTATRHSWVAAWVMEDGRLGLSSNPVEIDDVPRLIAWLRDVYEASA